MDTNEILEQREAQYGAFKTHAKISQELKEFMWADMHWIRLRKTQKEALEMIAHKIARILNGNPNYIDSWRDIAGYATLVVKELEQEQERGSDAP